MVPTGIRTAPMTQPTWTLWRLTLRSYSANAFRISSAWARASGMVGFSDFKKQIGADAFGIHFDIIPVGGVGNHVAQLFLITVNQIPVQNIFHGVTKRP